MTIDVGKVVGDSAYEVAVSEGYIGTKAEWLESLKGPNVVSTTTDSNISGLLKGANGKVAQAVAGTDYLVQHQSLAEYRKASQQDVIDASKADASDVYTKSETDSAISAHHDSSKADASTTYTKTEVDTAIAGHHDASKQDKIDASHKLSYNLLSDTPAIPTKTSDLTNDSGFLTQHQSLSAYRTSAAQDVIDASKQDALPTVVNDRYLHTNAATGSLEWAEVQGGGGGVADAVRYGAAQSLTDAQKQQARANIGAQELDVETVSITLSCEDETVSTAGLVVTKTEDGVQTTYTSDASGHVGFIVKRGHEYTMSYPSLGAWNKPATTTYTANSPARTINALYRGFSGVAWGVLMNQSQPNICQGLVGERSLWTTWQNKIGRYLLKPDGTARKLKADDSTKYVDGTTIDETEGDVMVRIPKFYYKVIDNGDGTCTLWGSETSFTECYEMPEQWIGAYFGYYTESKLRSRSGVNPTRSKTITDFHNAAKQIGSDYGLTDYKARQTMMMLFLWKYNTCNSQEPSCLGYGMTGSGSNWTTEVQNELAGRTATLGDACGGVAFTATGTLASHISLYGIEDPCCWFWEMIQGCYFGSSSNSAQNGTEIFLYEGNRMPTSTELMTHPEGNYRQLTRLTTSGHPKTMPLVDRFDLFATAYGGGASSYWYDYCYASATGPLLLFGGHAFDGSLCGLGCAASDHGFSFSASALAARLAYYGTVTVIE